MASKAKNTNTGRTVPAATAEVTANTVTEAANTDVAHVTDTQLPQEADPATLDNAIEQVPEAEAVIGATYPQDLDSTAAIAVRVKSGGTMWRGGQKFGPEFVVLYRDQVTNMDWNRIATEPLLQVRSVSLQEAQS